jgi:preprotein translocase subunit SecD
LKKNLSRIILTIVLIVLSIYFLYPTYKDYTLNKELQNLSGQDSLDFLINNSDEVRVALEKRIKLGLDLKGGMYVIMDVDVIKLLEDLARKKDDVLINTLNEVKTISNTSEDPILDIFKVKLQEKGLTLKSYYGEIRDDESDVESSLNDEIDNSIERAVEVVRNRVDQYGVAEPQIQKIGDNRILVELPGVSNPDDVRKLLQGTALLEFQMVYDPEKTVKIMQEINKVIAGTTTETSDTTENDLLRGLDLKDSNSLEKEEVLQSDTSKKTVKKDITKKDTSTKKVDSSDISKDTSDKTDTSLLSDTNILDDTTQQITEEEFMKQNPLFFTIATVNFESGAADAYVKESDKDNVERYLSREDVQAVIPVDMEFAWSQRTFEAEGEKIYILIALHKEAELTGGVIVDARSNIDPTTNTPIVTMEMDSEGSADWARITGANINKRCAIVLDGVVYSSPVIRNKITGGNSQIEGISNIQEAKLLEIVLKAGALPAPLQIIEERSIGPSLGEDSIRSGVISSVAALILVALFMVFYYKFGGSVADLALLINVLFVLGIMASFKATLTLPGIAGLILTLGMAVDTNVLIFERIREELNTGKPMRTAIDIGYKKAFSAIIDAHITSIITGLILYQFGTGPIQGFALTLLFGICANLFTAIVITHFIFDALLEKGKKFSFG